MRVVFTSLYIEACELWIERFGDDGEAYGIDQWQGRYHVIQF